MAESRHYPYGETRWTWGTTPTSLRFTGQRQEESLGLYQMGARWYDPALARWLSADMLVPDPANPQDLNRYSYVRNNPLLYTDPSGHECMVEDDDEYCSDDTPEIPPPPTTRPDFWEMTEQEQALAYAAYLRYLQNPEYYQRLYLELLNDDTMPYPEDLVHLNMWVQYAEDPASLDMFFGIDAYAITDAKVEEAQESYANGEISQEEWWTIIGPAFFIMGAMTIRSGSGREQGPVRVSHEIEARKIEKWQRRSQPRKITQLAVDENKLRWSAFKDPVHTQITVVDEMDIELKPWR